MPFYARYKAACVYNSLGVHEIEKNIMYLLHLSGFCVHQSFQTDTSSSLMAVINGEIITEKYKLIKRKSSQQANLTFCEPCLLELA